MHAFGTGNRTGHNSSEFYARKMYSQLSIPLIKSSNIPNKSKVPSACLNKIYCQSSSSMAQLPDGCVDLMVTSPPYNVGKDYDDNLTEKEYMDLLYSVFCEVNRVLVSGGRACINIANIGRKPYIPLNTMITNMMLGLGFFMRGEIIWDKGASAGNSCAWGSWCSASNPVLRDVHEYILIFSKDVLKIRNAGDSSKSTIKRDDFLECTKSIWKFPAESAKRVGHPAPFPVELPRRLVELYTYEGNIVLDPFMGSGTTAVASVNTGRHFVGYDTNQDYVDLATSRVD